MEVTEFVPENGLNPWRVNHVVEKMETRVKTHITMNRMVRSSFFTHLYLVVLVNR